MTKKRKKRHTPEQFVKKLRDANAMLNAGKDWPLFCRRWRLLRRHITGGVRSIEEARQSVFDYIDTFYNQKRIHQTLEYKTPNQFEDEFKSQLTV